MRKIIFLILILSLFFSSAIMAKEMTREDILQKLDEISAIENDIARLEAYDKLVSSLNINLDQNKESSLSNNIIKEYSGSGMQSTRPFTVDNAWEIQWSASGEVFQIYLYEKNGNLVNIAANQMGAGKGSYYSPKTGTFYLEVNAMGNWEVKIVNVD
ncbi:MAG: hypothetical protein ACQESS_02875 [Bacillota bacterium]